MTILGVLGEADKLTERERDEVIVTTIEAAGSSFPVCVGTTHAGTDGCIAYSRRAQELGAATLMIAPPKLARTNDGAVRKALPPCRHGRRLPIVVQDFPPAVGGITMSPGTDCGTGRGVATARAFEARRLLPRLQLT